MRKFKFVTASGKIKFVEDVTIQAALAQASTIDMLFDRIISIEEIEE